MSAPAGTWRAGFTLVELLTVVAILGIIFGAFGWYLLRALRQSELREAASQLVGDLRRTRAGAQQTGEVSTLTLGAKTSYTVQRGSAPPQTRAVPNRVTVEPASGGVASVAYQPPFGTLEAPGVVWIVQSPADPAMRLYVKVVGVTGKVMLSAARD